MIRILILMLLFPTISVAWNQMPPKSIQECSIQTPYGVPESKNKLEESCRHAYAHGIDTTAKIPAWTSYTLTPDHAIGCLPRSDVFAPDQSFNPKDRAELRDYLNSGFDKGHMGPDGDMSFDLQAEYESFLLTNMVPQTHVLNAGVWKTLETSIRAWAVQLNHDFTIYAGPIYDKNDKTIGPDKVVVPHGFYKIVIDDQTKQYAAFVFPHYGKLEKDILVYVDNVENIEKQTGISFKLPKDGKELNKSEVWPADIGKLAKDKKIKCAK